MAKFDQKYEASHEISQECLDVLVNYPWKGNVRELENLMERFSITIKESVINVHDLPLKFLGQNKTIASPFLGIKIIKTSVDI